MREKLQNKRKNRIEKEKETLNLMISIYCRHKHQNKNATLCPDCQELLSYANNRLDKCRLGNDKTSCKHCLTHCYSPAMRERIRIVMRWTGPRMIYYAPLAYLKHFFKQ